MEGVPKQECIKMIIIMHTVIPLRLLNRQVFEFLCPNIRQIENICKRQKILKELRVSLIQHRQLFRFHCFDKLTNA